MNAGVYRLTKDSTIGKDLNFKAGQEFEVVQNVVYMGGYPLPSYLQKTVMDWMDNNKSILINDTRNF